MARIAVVGATGLVGGTMLRVLAERAFPVDALVLYGREEGEAVFAGETHRVLPLTEGGVEAVDVALFSAGGEVSRAFARTFVSRGAYVVDNSSAFRDSCPLVVPEVNADALAACRGIVAVPNCATVQLVYALAPLARAFGLRLVTVTTMQSVSGAGREGERALEAEERGKTSPTSPFPAPVRRNLIPWIGEDEGGWCTEERKVERETRVILGLPELAVAATTVRVPVLVGHSEAVAAVLGREVTREEVIAALGGAPCVRPADGLVTLLDVVGSDEVTVSRVRVADERREVALMWLVADNLRVGAATCAVKIAERLLGVRVS